MAALRKAGALPQQRDGLEPSPQRSASPRSWGHRGPLQLLQSCEEEDPDVSRARERTQAPKRTVGASAGGSTPPRQRGGHQMQGSLVRMPTAQEHLVNEEQVQPSEEAPAAVRRPHQKAATVPAHLNYKPFLEDAAADVQHVHRARVFARQPPARAVPVPSPDLRVSRKTTPQAQVETQHQSPRCGDRSAGQSSCQDQDHEGGPHQPAGAGDSWQGPPPAHQAPPPAPRPAPAVQLVLPQHTRVPPHQREAGPAEQLPAQHQHTSFRAGSRSQWQPDFSDGDEEALYEPICGRDSAGRMLLKLSGNSELLCIRLLSSPAAKGSRRC